MRKIIIDPKIFETFPDFKRGLVIVSDINNSLENKAIDSLLRKEIKEKANLDYKNLPEVLAWDETHRKFGSNPNNYPPSIKSLLERVAKGKNIPFINSVVAAFNYISLKYLVPCGGDDLGEIEGNLCLGFAEGNEKFRSIGSEEDDNPIPGEVIYFGTPSRRVMCRRWNWRNGNFAKITEKSKKILLNVEGIGSVSAETIMKARDELAKLLADHYSATLTIDYLDKDKGRTDLDF
jgi:lysyl-tRNA synthetase class 2